MTCEKVLGCLSLFLDDMLGESHAAEVSCHLRECSGCEREFLRLKSLQSRLREMAPAAAPEYLKDLVERRIAGARAASWAYSLRSDLEYGWSRVRTTEGTWYAIRLMGALATVLLFIAVSASMGPIYIEIGDHMTERGETQAARVLATSMQKLFGAPVQSQKKPAWPSEPKINDEYLANFAESASHNPQNDTVSVVTMIDSSGAAKVQDILEYPIDDSLLSDYTEMISTAAWRPASRNGQAINSPLVLTFTKIFVYN